MAIDHTKEALKDERQRHSEIQAMEATYIKKEHVLRESLAREESKVRLLYTIFRFGILL